MEGISFVLAKKKKKIKIKQEMLIESIKAMKFQIGGSTNYMYMPAGESLICMVWWQNKKQFFEMLHFYGLQLIV